MERLRRAWHRLLNVIRHGRAEDELAREVDAHLGVLEDEYRRRGMTDADARRAARRAMNGVEQTKERQRDARAFRWLDDLRQDARYALRSFSRAPGFTAVAVLTLALGIGANTAIFSVVNGVMLRPLPYPEADRLVHLREYVPGEMQLDGQPRWVYALDTRDFLEWERSSRLLSHVALYDADIAMTLDHGDDPLRLNAAFATSSLFAALGISPVRGPGLNPRDEDLARTVIISHRLWRTLFDSTPDILNRIIPLDGAGYRIVGVMPEGFAFPSRDTALWVPLIPRVDPNVMTSSRPIARLASGASLTAATAETASVLTGIRGRLRPDLPVKPGEPRFELVQIQEDLVAPVRQALLVLVAGVAFVLLIACANVANLLLARHSARQGEAAVRVALGAGRSRLVRQLLTESTLLAVLGGLLGLLLAHIGVRVLVGLGPTDLPRLQEIAIDRRVLSFAFAACAATAVTLGLLPALRVSRASPISAIKSQAGVTSSTRIGSRTWLVSAEMALATVLLVGGSLLLRSFVNVSSVSPGFDPENLLIFRVAVDRGAASRAAAVAASDAFLARLQTLPGVRGVGFSNRLPLRSRDGTLPRIDGAPDSVEGRPDARIVNASYLHVMGIRLRVGRFFEDADGAGRPMVVLVNETLARHYGGAGPLGRVLTVAGRPAEIAGVVEDTREDGLDRAVRPMIYMDARQSTLRALSEAQAVGWAFYAVRTDGEPATLVPEIRRVVHAAVPNATLELDVDSMAGIIASSIAQRRFYALALGIFAALAVALAAIGVYGVMAYAVTQRTHEIGIRMALGAAGYDVVSLVIGQSLPFTIAGMATGLMGAGAATQVLEGMLFGLTPLDPSTFASAAAVLAALAMAAAFVPARRAARVDPLIALRCE